MKLGRWRVAGALVLGLLAASPWGAVPAAQVSSWFRADFNNAGSGQYNFSFRYPSSATTWLTDHQSTGGWNSSGAAHVVVKGCTGATGRPCTTGDNQFNIGWVTPAPPAGGNTVFVRFRIKFDPNTHFGVTGGGLQFGAKFLLQGTSGNNRWIYHLYPPYASNGCTLGFDSYGSMGWTPPATQWYRARQDWGLSGEWRDAPHANLYAGFTPNVNISWSCAPAVLVTRSNHASPPKTQRNGAAAVNGWTHLQLQVIAGSGSGFRQWANNNDLANPSSERLNLPDTLNVSSLSHGVVVGGYWGMAQSQDIGFTIDDFEVGPTFDPSWYPGGSGGATPQAPAAPVGVRLTVGDN